LVVFIIFFSSLLSYSSIYIIYSLCDIPFYYMKSIYLSVYGYLGLVDYIVLLLSYDMLSYISKDPLEGGDDRMAWAQLFTQISCRSTLRRRVVWA